MIISKIVFSVPVPDSITIRFYEELNDFLHYSRRKKAFDFILTGKRSIKDIIEALGIPHTEVDLILADQKPVNFDYHPQNGDYISVYPVFEAIDISSINLLRPKPLRKTRFILDVHLGTLAKHLRLMGFDTYYRNDLRDEEIIRRSVTSQRIILTRDLPMLKNGIVTHGYFVRNTNPFKQLQEVVRRFDLIKQIKPFHRCLECNGIIEKVDKNIIEDKLETNTRKTFDEFYQCRSCKKVYWKGSHYEQMMKVIDKVSLNPPPLPEKIPCQSPVSGQGTDENQGNLLQRH
jgi:uncharacterized protein